MPRRLLGALASAVLLSSLASAVLAHAALQGATPGPGDIVTGSPAQIVAQFSQNLDPSRTSLEVRDSSGARVARGGELGDGPREFRLDLPQLEPGVYEVRWTTYSTEDDQVERDAYTFEVLAGSAPPATSTSSPETSAKPSVSPSSSASATPRPSFPFESSGPGSDTSGTPAATDVAVIVPIVGALALVGAFGLWAVRRQRP